MEKAVSEIGGNSVGFVSDTANIKDIKALYEKVKEKFDTIDVLFLNAGVATFGPFAEVDEVRIRQHGQCEFQRPVF